MMLQNALNFRTLKCAKTSFFSNGNLLDLNQNTQIAGF